MGSRVMGWGRTAAVALAVCMLGSSRLAAVPRPAAAAFQAAPIPNLAAYWPLDASPATDLSGNTNTGTFNSGAAIDTVPAEIAPVPAGNVASANFPTLGGGNRIDVPDSTSLSITGSISISAWIRTNLSAPSANAQEIVGKFSGTGGYFFRVTSGTPDDGLNFSLVSGSGVAAGVAGTHFPIVASTWYHVVGTYDTTGGVAHLYVNGVVSSDMATGVAAPAASGTGLIIGRNGVNEFNGQIDEVRIYSKALTDLEVVTLFNGVQPAPSALLATPGAGQIGLSWTAPASGPTSPTYNIYRAVGGGAFSYYASSASTSYTDLGVSNPTSYSYKVTSVAALESAQIGPATAVPAPSLPPPPHVKSSGGNNNIWHRCGCSSASPSGAWGLLAAAGLSLLLLVLARKA